jgi:hypothetical protein
MPDSVDVKQPMDTMKSFSELFQERAGRVLALSKISQIALEGLSQISKDRSSAFTPMFESIARHIPSHHQNHSAINVPEYKVIAFLDGLTLIATVSEVEAYFQDLVVTVLVMHPEKIGKSSFELKSLLELSSIQEAKELAAQRFASEMLFKKPNDYKKDLVSVLSIREEVFKSTWPVFVEAKARRDIGVHNGWLVNDIYRAKIREVGLSPSIANALSVDHPYLQSVRTSCIELMGQMKAHCESAFA